MVVLITTAKCLLQGLRGYLKHLTSNETFLLDVVDCSLGLPLPPAKRNQAFCVRNPSFAFGLVIRPTFKIKLESVAYAGKICVVFNDWRATNMLQIQIMSI